ncbi:MULTISPECIES: hypothetical protein [unclassified Halomonas]|uniref:hypothetical protein n=1 Tax=Halomonas sp. N3-2A TaxID=2014541 RepID=UPI000B5B4922|nr:MULTISPECIES: hypothetical protein [unclassified Halomonas]ASK21126.1 hypothetical protein CEK60_18290 [Halomonas sp. N3-2A]UTD56907.1 hypothetical protein NF683_06685 [Halomonas sp. MS1]
MLLKSFVKSTVVVGLSLGLIASPIAFAHSSIELNQGRAENQEIIQPQSRNTSGPATYSAKDLINDNENTLIYAPSSRASDADDDSKERAGYRAEELNREEGSSTRW